MSATRKKRLLDTGAAAGIILEKLLVMNHYPMNVLIIVLSLISAYILFISVSYLVARLLFPRIEVTDLDEKIEEKPRLARLRRRNLSRAVR